MTASAWSTFWKKHWQLFGLFGGLAFFLGSIAASRLVIHPWHRARLLSEFRDASQAYAGGDYQTSEVLARSILPRLWRAEQITGDTYFLLGASVFHQQSGTGDEKEQAKAEEAMAYIAAARDLGVSHRHALELSDLYGESLHRIGNYPQAILAFDRSLQERRKLESVLHYRTLQADLLEPSPSGEPFAASLDRWFKSAEESLPMSNASRELRETLISDGEAAAREMLADTARDWLPVTINAQIAHIDLTAAAKLASGDIADAKAYLANENAANNHAMSRLLRSFADSYTRKLRSDYVAAMERTNERLALADLTESDRNDARRQQAEYLTKLGRPAEARRLLQQLANSVGFDKVAFLLAESSFDEAEQMATSSLATWLRDHPWVESWDRTSSYWLRGGEPAEKVLARMISASRQEIADEVSANRIKSILTNAAYARTAQYYEEIVKEPQFDRKGEDEFGRSLLKLGRSYERLGRPKDALRVYHDAVEYFPRLPIGLAAQILQDAVVAKTGDLVAIDNLSKSVTAAAETSSPWKNYVPAAELESIFEGIWRGFESAGDSRTALKVAEVYAPFASPGKADEAIATSARNLADELSAQATASIPANEALLEEARSYYQLSGKHFLHVAEFRRAGSEYADLLWQASIAFTEGHSYPEAEAAVKEFIKAHGENGERDLAANVLLARAQMALGRFAEAKGSLEEALDRSENSPVRFEARLRLAQCCMQLASEPESAPETAPAASSNGAAEADGRRQLLQQAEILLVRNIDGQGLDLDPTASVWRRSLFQLGELQIAYPRYDEAIATFDEAVRRYPDDPKTNRSTLAIADAYLASARLDGEAMKTENSPRRNLSLARTRSEKARMAVATLRTLVDKLAARQRRQPLAPDDDLVLQESYLKVGECFYELGDWQSARDAFATTAGLYDGRPTALVAYVQLAFTYWKLNEDAQAKSSLRQAVAALERMPDEAFRDSELTKQDWSRRLGNLAGGL